MEQEGKHDKLKRQITAASMVVISATIAAAGAFKFSIMKELNVNMDMARSAYIDYLINGSEKTCLEQLRMSQFAFHNLCELLSERNLLKPTLYLPVEHQVAMFLHTVAHDVRNSTISSRFFRSGETVSRYFHRVLAAILTLRDEYLVQPTQSSPTSQKIAESDRYWPWFQDCIGAIDGTHVRAKVPVNIQGRFRGRKEHHTQNVLAAVSFDLKFTYVLTGWEGSAHDSLIVDDALRRRNGLHVPNGKYYLGDAGYGVRKGIVPPYRGVKYHLKEYSNHGPENYKELFNLRHSSIRTTIERAFGILKIRFPLLDSKKHWSYETQVEIVIVCCVLHNYIMSVDPHDEILNEGIVEEAVETEPLPTSSQRQRTAREQRDENIEWTQKRDAIAQDMYKSYIASL